MKHLTINELIAAYQSNASDAIRAEIIERVNGAKALLRRHDNNGILSDKNIADLNANIAKAEAAIG